jgi:CRISPR-associated protein Cmr2
MEPVTDAILIFTFSPIQEFIAEARRAGDLYAGSRILVKLAQAAGKAIGPERLIYPALRNSGLLEDMPNKLVAKVPWEQVRSLAQAAEQALKEEWRGQAASAKKFLAENGPPPDQIWQQIWQRQMENCWECYWAAALLSTAEGYKAAYNQASKALDAAKRSRVFAQCLEDGQKDSLSGRRSALRVAGMGGKEYWAAVSRSPKVTRAQLRPGGEERLDALGAVKRFGGLAEKFPSVSSVATADFVDKARHSLELPPYRQAVEDLLRNNLYCVRKDAFWPYDGDLFFLETLTPGRLKDSYGMEKPDGTKLQQAKNALCALQQSVGMRPCPYYALVLLDGDNMGQRVGECQSEIEHWELSRKVSQFAAGVDGIAGRHMGHRIYAGGDDVFALAPLSTVIPLAQELADAFHEKAGGTISAGIALAHHLYPLDAALRAAHQAKRQAKDVNGKAAIGVQAIKRSGETVAVRSRWDDIGTIFVRLINWFQSKALSSRFAYDVAHAAYTLNAGNMFQAELRRLIRRHRDSKKENAPDPETLAQELNNWAMKLQEGAEGLACWLLLTRFMAQGGGE